jgi:hypothetical protein
MNVYVLNQSLDIIDIIEDYYSLIWVERYYEAGDFELNLPIDYDQRPSLVFGNFLYIKDSTLLMQIQDKKPQTGQDISSLIITGESSESILKSRVIISPKYIKGVIETLMYDLIQENITDPSEPIVRKIDLFLNTFPTVTITKTYSEIFDEGTLYDIISTVCKNSNLGFKIEKSGDRLAFSIREGVDRSYGQSETQYVIFSPDFDNVLSSSFYESVSGQINSVLVVTDDLEPLLQKVWVYEDDVTVPEDLDRVELFLETNIDRDVDGGPLNDADVLEIIKTRGRDIIRERKNVGLFEGDFDIQGNFKYGVHFFMGDIIQCKIENRKVSARLLELIRSYSTEGNTSYGTMDFIN